MFKAWLGHEALLSSDFTAPVGSYEIIYQIILGNHEYGATNAYAKE